VFRQYERVRWPGLLAVLGFVLGAAVAFGAAYVIVPPPSAARLTLREFPGFAIGMPSGEEKDRNDGDATGKLELVDVVGTGGVVAVRWEPGAALDASELDALAQGLAGARRRRADDDEDSRPRWHGGRHRRVRSAERPDVGQHHRVRRSSHLG
jgi:hypothetical protein